MKNSLGSESVHDEQSANERTGEVKGVGEASPAQRRGQGGVLVGDSGDGGRVKTERVHNPVVQEPAGRDRSELDPIPFEDEPIGDVSSLDAVLEVRVGLLHLDPEVEEQERRNHTKSEREPPNQSEVVLAADLEEQPGDERRNNEAEVAVRRVDVSFDLRCLFPPPQPKKKGKEKDSHHGVGRELEEHLLSILCDALAFRVLSAGNTPRWILRSCSMRTVGQSVVTGNAGKGSGRTYADSEQESVSNEGLEHSGGRPSCSFGSGRESAEDEDDQGLK